jgi:hypothetical protein
MNLWKYNKGSKNALTKAQSFNTEDAHSEDIRDIVYGPKVTQIGRCVAPLLVSNAPNAQGLDSLIHVLFTSIETPYAPIPSTVKNLESADPHALAPADVLAGFQSL